MLNFLIHQIFNNISLHMDGNTKMECRAVSVECSIVLEVKLSSVLTFANSWVCHCAIKHGGGIRLEPEGRTKPSSTLKATSTEMPWRRKFSWQELVCRFGVRSRVQFGLGAFKESKLLTRNTFPEKTCAQRVAYAPYYDSREKNIPPILKS